MYATKKLLYQVATDEGSEKSLKEIQRKCAVDYKLIRETGHDSKGERVYRIQDSVSDTPRAPDCVYTQNDRYLDLRTPFDDKRGLMTLMGCLCFMGFWLSLSMLGDIPFIIWHHEYDGLGDLLAIFFVFFIVFGYDCRGRLVYPPLRAPRILRAAAFAGAFRPGEPQGSPASSALRGGIVSLDWDRISAIVVDEKDTGNIGMPSILFWDMDATPDGLPVMLVFGRLARDDAEQRHRWEFIRRFMEDGPESVLRQKRIGKFPWPWRSVMSSLGLFWPIFRFAELRWAIPLVALASPAVLIFAAGNWLSLLLCWEPVFPRAIRRACGEPGWSVLQARLIDLGAWAMLAGLIWWIWPSWKAGFGCFFCAR